MIEFFWINNTHLSVNGEEMLPEEAYRKYPNEASKIKDFVQNTKNPTSKLRSYMQSNILARSINDNYHNMNQLTIERCADIKAKISEIFETLKIKGNSIKDQKRNAYKLFEYIITHSKYDPTIMQEKDRVFELKQGIQDYKSLMYDMEIMDIHNCLCQNRSVCSSDAASLSLMFNIAGIASHHITIAERGDAPQSFHEVVTMILGDNQYICDPTLVRQAIADGNIPKVSPSFFAFTPNEFFEQLYPSKEIKCEHEPLYL